MTSGENRGEDDQLQKWERPSERGFWNEHRSTRNLKKKSQHQLILIHGYTSIMAGAMNIEQVMQTKTINNDKAQICCLFVASAPQAIPTTLNQVSIFFSYFFSMRTEAKHKVRRSRAIESRFLAISRKCVRVVKRSMFCSNNERFEPVFLISEFRNRWNHDKALGHPAFHEIPTLDVFH